MNKTKIEWCDFTFNPVVGCKHNCNYCYAKQVNNRYKFIENWEEPKYFQDRLLLKVPNIPKNRNVIVNKLFPNNPVVFVGSMCDLFGSWVNENWINQTIQYTDFYPNVQFMFLTKNPQGYKKWNFPKNCWLGTSIESNQQRNRIEILKEHSHPNKFVSIEPLIGGMEGVDFKCFNFLIVGAMTGKNPIKPSIEIVQSIKHPQIYYKNNILKYYPNL